MALKVMRLTSTVSVPRIIDPTARWCTRAHFDDCGTPRALAIEIAVARSSVSDCSLVGHIVGSLMAAAVATLGPPPAMAGRAPSYMKPSGPAGLSQLS